MASVTYKIGGKYDNSAISQAKRGIQDFQKVLNAVKGAAVVKALSDITKKALECESAFLEAEQAVKKIDFAAAINPNLNRTSKQLQKFAGDVSASLRGAISVDDINAQIAKLSFDKTGEQIEKIIPAAIDLSAALGISLDEAVTQLNNTFAGTTGTLGKMFPELKTLSKEALASGDAIDIIAQKTKGMGDVMAQSGIGSVQAYKNEIDNMKEAIGRASTNFFTPLRDYLTDVIKSWTDAKNAMLDYKDAQKNLKAGTATIDDLKLLSDKATQAVADYQNNYTRAGDRYLAKDGSGPVAGIDTSTYLQGLNELIQKQKAASSAYTAELAKLQNAEAAKADAERQAAKNVTTTTADLNKVVKTTSDRYRENGEAALAYAEHQKRANDEVIELQIALRKTREAQEKAAEEQEKNVQEMGKAMLKATLISGAGEVGGLITDIKAGGALGGAANILEKIFTKLSEVSDEFAFFQNILSELIGASIAPLAEGISSFLAPIIDFMADIVPATTGLFRAVGVIIQALGYILEIFTPVFDLIANTLKVIATVIVTVADFISNILTFIYNAVVSIYNFFAWDDISKKSYRSVKDDVAEIWNPSQAYTPELSGYAAASASTNSGSASYTAAKDVYVNVYYNNSYVNGDAQAIALNIRDEIKRAERLGY